jgi:hypothetical protein
MHGDRIAAVVPPNQREKHPALHRTGALICLALLLFTAGCAPKLYNVDMRYEPTKAIRAVDGDGRKYSLTVASFIDQRKIADTLLIGRVIRGDGTPIPILPKYVKPMDAVAEALRSLLRQAGYGVAPDKPAWDLQEANLRPEWGTLLVGGTVDELDVTCLDNLTMTRYTAKAKVTLIFADVQKKRIFYRVSSESSSSLDHIVFSEAKLESQINGVLSDAMEKIVEGPEMGRRIREVLQQ